MGSARQLLPQCPGHLCFVSKQVGHLPQTRPEERREIIASFSTAITLDSTIE